MKRERKIHDPAFKTKAVQLSSERTNISELARKLGIKATFLYKWRKEYEEFGEGSFLGNGNLKLTPKQEKIHELEKKLKDAELECDILKKAIGIFCYFLFKVFMNAKAFQRTVDEIWIH